MSSSYPIVPYVHVPHILGLMFGEPRSYVYSITNSLEAYPCECFVEHFAYRRRRGIQIYNENFHAKNFRIFWHGLSPCSVCVVQLSYPCPSWGMLVLRNPGKWHDGSVARELCRKCHPPSCFRWWSGLWVESCTSEVKVSQMKIQNISKNRGIKIRSCGKFAVLQIRYFRVIDKWSIRGDTPLGALKVEIFLGRAKWRSAY